MYPEEQYHRAFEIYAEIQSVTRTIALLGYPAPRQTLYNWINWKSELTEYSSSFCGCNTTEHPRHPLAAIKLGAPHRRFALDETMQEIADKLKVKIQDIELEIAILKRPIRQHKPFMQQ